MSIRVWAAAIALATSAPVVAKDGVPPLKFLERKDLPYPQSTPFPMEQTSEAVRDHNKQVVLDFYKVISDKRAWTDENMNKYFQPDFIQHDPAEPSTSAAFFNMFREMNADRAKAQAAGGAAPGGPMKMVGKTAKDSNGSPINWLVAEGDIVIAVRHRNWEWPGGPEPVYNGIFVDVWRLKDGKLAEQWCSCTPADAQLKRIMDLKQRGLFPKDPE